jgi:hypothetical protein
MTALLIAVLSCQRDRSLGYHETIRERWGARLSDISDVRFFVGGPRLDDLKIDEVWLDVPDDYSHLSIKTKAICDWTLKNGYNFLFKCDNDTTIFVTRFRNYDYKDVDYAGRFWGGQPGAIGLYAAGPGYFLSRKACEIISIYGGTPTAEEDVMVGNTLQPYISSSKIKAQHIESSVYGSTKGPGNGAVHGAAQAWVMIQRGDGLIVPRLRDHVIPSDVVVNEEP